MTATYPDRPIVVAAPFPPRHVSDLHARLLAPHLAEALNTAVTVDNWPGASGTVALQRLSEIEPDGYTVMMHGYGGLAVTPHLLGATYDPRTDFTPIIKLTTAPLVLVAHPHLPADSVQELVAFAAVQSIPEVTLRMQGAGYEVEISTPEEFAALIRDEYER